MDIKARKVSKARQGKIMPPLPRPASDTGSGQSYGEGPEQYASVKLHLLIEPTAIAYLGTRIGTCIGTGTGTDIKNQVTSINIRNSMASSRQHSIAEAMKKS